MTIQIELTDNVETQLRSEAAARGIPPEQYALTLLQNSLGEFRNPSGILTVQDFHKMLEELAEGSEHLPNLPTSSFTRESFYED